MKNPFSTIICFNFLRRTHIIGFSWKYGLYIYLLGGAGLIHPLLLFLSSKFWIEINLLSMGSLAIFISSALLMSVLVGYRISISKKHFKFYRTILLIPYESFKAKIDNVVFSEKSGQEEQVNISIQDDPWAEMGFKDWVQIKYQGKIYDIGDNENFQTLFGIISESIRNHTSDNMASIE